MLVTGLAEQAPRPKRIGSLTLPLASLGDPLKRGVRYMDIYYKRKPGSKGICHRLMARQYEGFIKSKEHAVEKHP